MLSKEKERSVSGTVVFCLTLINAVIIQAAFLYDERWYWILFMTFPVLLLAIYKARRTKQDKVL